MKAILKPLLAGLFITAGSLKAQQPPPMQSPSPEIRLKQVTVRLEKDLSLKAEQKQKVEQAYKTFFAGMQKLRASTPPPQPPPPPPPPRQLPPVNREAMDKLVKTRDESVKKALTEEQFKKYQEIEKTMQPDHRGGPPPRRPGGPDGRPGGPDEHADPGPSPAGEK